MTGSRLVALAHEQLELPKGTFEALRGGDRQGPLLLYLHGFPDHPPTAAPLSRTWRAPAARIAAARDLGLIRRLWRRWSPELNLDRDRRDQLHSCLPSSLPAPIAYYRAALRPWATRRVLHELREPISTPLLQLHGADDGCVARPPADGLSPLRRPPRARGDPRHRAFSPSRGPGGGRREGDRVGAPERPRLERPTGTGCGRGSSSPLLAPNRRRAAPRATRSDRPDHAARYRARARRPRRRRR